jgi:hypothetical protein
MQNNTYLFTSSNFSGSIYFKFDEADKLISYDAEAATLSPEQYDWLLNRLPRSLQELQMIIKKSKGARLTKQLKESWLFDEFWKIAYINKGSSKKLSLKIWNKYPQKERDKAANYWPTYIRQKADGEGIKYVETYLRSEIWNN